jgi:hypothetical protein
LKGFLGICEFLELKIEDFEGFPKIWLYTVYNEVFVDMNKIIVEIVPEIIMDSLDL